MDNAAFCGALCARETGATDEDFARFAIRNPSESLAWMKRYGVKFQPACKGTLHLDWTSAFFLGGGKALTNTYYAEASRAGHYGDL